MKNKRLNPRELAQSKYYSAKTRYATIEQTRDLAKKMPKRHNNPREYGNICLVKLDNIKPFYTVNYFPSWAGNGSILGMWNEITLIERL